MRIILISGAHPVPHRPRPWPAGARRAGQGRRQPASGASVTLDAPEHVGTIIAAMGDIRDLRSTTPTAVTFTLNQDTQRTRSGQNFARQINPPSIANSIDSSPPNAAVIAPGT